MLGLAVPLAVVCLLGGFIAIGSSAPDSGVGGCIKSKGTSWEWVNCTDSHEGKVVSVSSTSTGCPEQYSVAEESVTRKGSTTMTYYCVDETK
jgi:hypothetical protein